MENPMDFLANPIFSSGVLTVQKVYFLGSESWHACVLSCWVMSDSVTIPLTVARYAPKSMDSPGKNTG